MYISLLVFQAFLFPFYALPIPLPSLFLFFPPSISHAHFSAGVHTKASNKTNLFSLFIEALPRWDLRTVLGCKWVSLSLSAHLSYFQLQREGVYDCNNFVTFYWYLRGILTLRSLQLFSKLDHSALLFSFWCCQLHKSSFLKNLLFLTSLLFLF